MPSPYTALTTVTPTTGQIKATDISQMTTAQANQPQGLLAAPTQLSSNSAGTTSTSTVSPPIAMSQTVTVAASRRIRVGCDGFANSSVVSDYIWVLILKDSVVVESGLCPASQGMGVIFEDTPAAGSHTYAVGYSREAGTGSVFLTGSIPNVGVPTTMYVEDMGAV